MTSNASGGGDDVEMCRMLAALRDRLAALEREKEKQHQSSIAKEFEKRVSTALHKRIFDAEVDHHLADVDSVLAVDSAHKRMLAARHEYMTSMQQLAQQYIDSILRHDNSLKQGLNDLRSEADLWVEAESQKNSDAENAVEITAAECENEAGQSPVIRPRGIEAAAGSGCSIEEDLLLLPTSLSDLQLVSNVGRALQRGLPIPAQITGILDQAATRPSIQPAPIQRQRALSPIGFHAPRADGKSAAVSDQSGPFVGGTSLPTMASLDGSLYGATEHNDPMAFRMFSGRIPYPNIADQSSLLQEDTTTQTSDLFVKNSTTNNKSPSLKENFLKGDRFTAPVAIPSLLTKAKGYSPPANIPEFPTLLTKRTTGVTDHRPTMGKHGSSAFALPLKPQNHSSTMTSTEQRQGSEELELRNKLKEYSRSMVTSAPNAFATENATFTVCERNSAAIHIAEFSANDYGRLSSLIHEWLPLSDLNAAVHALNVYLNESGVTVFKRKDLQGAVRGLLNEQQAMLFATALSNSGKLDKLKSNLKADSSHTQTTFFACN